MSKETLKLLLEALGYVLTPHGGTRAHVWDSDEARFVVQAYKVVEEALKQEQGEPDYWLGYGLQAHTEKPFEGATPLYTTPRKSND
jgi:hypothetical protein